MSPKSSDPGPSLLEHSLRQSGETTPLAERLRPRTLDEIVGQEELLRVGAFLRRAIEADRLPSLILWGPPGVGKTTIAQVIAHSTQREFVPFSAVLGGVPELRTILKRADEDRKFRGKSTILFVDEIHRFNRAQQDAFLPHVESGVVTLIGATTENPSFAVNAALLSRARVLSLKPLTDEALETLIERTLADARAQLAIRSMTDEARRALARAARGDARRTLNLLEAASELWKRRGDVENETTLGLEELSGLLTDNSLLYDKSGDEHYNIASAFIKSLRGSDPDAALYYLLRMLDAGEDPLFLARRMIIFASEDVGNADPRALQLAIAADQAFQRLGMPEGVYPLAHACLYLASAAKSGAVKNAIGLARAALERHGPLPVPLKLRNAPTRLMKDQGYGQDYRYAHDYAEGFVPGETYLPDTLTGTEFYQPTEHGLEKAIKEKLERIRNGRSERG